jgi:hypothetical protein
MKCAYSNIFVNQYFILFSNIQKPRKGLALSWNYRNIKKYCFNMRNVFDESNVIEGLLPL